MQPHLRATPPARHTGRRQVSDALEPALALLFRLVRFASVRELRQLAHRTWQVRSPPRRASLLRRFESCSGPALPPLSFALCCLGYARTPSEGSESPAGYRCTTAAAALPWSGDTNDRFGG